MNQINLLSNRNFQLHCLSCIISQVGSFFSFIALPWLVLAMTNNNPVVMSTVMATSSLPQAFFILFGGVLADRFSPLKLLFISRILFVVVMTSLAYAVYTESISLWLLYGYAFLLGLLGSITLPASQALLPSLVEVEQLPTANGMVMGSAQLAQVIGPIFAGWLIWLVKMLHGVPATDYDHVAFAMAFCIDALGVSIAIVLMFFMHSTKFIPNNEKLLFMLKQGFSFCWQDKAVAVVLLYLVLISFFLQGTVMAGLPVFTKINLGLAERGYGNLCAMFGLGTVIGIGSAMIWHSSIRQMGILVLSCDLVSGVGLFMLGNTNNFVSAAICLLFMGGAGGVIMVAGTTWFQQRTPGFLMGRILSILMFCIMGFIPISVSITGMLMTTHPINQIMNFSGCIIIFFTLIGLALPAVRKLGHMPKIEFSS